jgi:hypothetical protein
MSEAQFEPHIAKAVTIAVAAVEGTNAIVKAARTEAVKAKMAKRAEKHAVIQADSQGSGILGAYSMTLLSRNR